MGDSGIHPRIDRRRVHAEVGRVVGLAHVVHVLAVVQRRFVDVVLRLGLAVGDVEEAPYRRLAEETAPRSRVVFPGLEALAVALEALGDLRVRHARHHHGDAGPAALDERLDGDHAAPDRRMRPLHGARPDRGQPDREELPLVDERLLGPGAREHLDRFLHPFATVVTPEAEADVLVLVVAGAAADADLQTPAAEVVEHGELDGEAHGMVERHLDDGEPQPRARGARRERAGEWNRVGIGALAGEVVLGEPEVIEAHRLGQHPLLELLMDAGQVIRGRRGQGQGHPPELHGVRTYGRSRYDVQRRRQASCHRERNCLGLCVP